MNIINESIVGDLVAQDYRTASVFKSHGIDFCCKGNRSIEEVCEKENIDSEILINELITAQHSVDSSSNDYQSWDLDLLADYIEKKHHRYVQKTIPELRAYLHKVAKVHGQRHPELIEIENLFNDSSHELLNHMQKEERILFPYIKQMVEKENIQEKLPKPHFGTVQNPIQMMKHEHENEGDRFRRISELSNNYNPPMDACTTYRVAFSLLKEFEEDLHLHIHLENNILFPGAIVKEKSL